MRFDPTAEHLDAIRSVTSVNLMTNAEWVATFPLDVRLALASAEDYGVGIGDDASQDALFYEVKANYLGTSSNTGAIGALVTDALREHFDGFGVPFEDANTIIKFVRFHAMHAGTWPEPLSRMMRFVDQAGSDDE